MSRFKFGGTWFDGQNAIVEGGVITVYLAGTTTLATAYESEAGSALTNSQTTTATDTGAFEFWVDDGDYPSSQKFRFIGTKTNFKNLDDSANTDNLQIIISAATTTETLTNKTISTDDNTITVNEADIQDLGTITALVTDNLSAFAATTSAQLASVLSDETGSGGGFVRATGPTINNPTVVTPTIVDFTDATHDHTDAASGGALSTDLGQISATDITITGSAAATPDANTLTKDHMIGAWCTLDGTGTPSYIEEINFTGAITDNGAGNYVLTIDRNFAANTYAGLGTGNDATADSISIQSKAVGSCNVRAISDSGAAVNGLITVVLIGAQ